MGFSQDDFIRSEKIILSEANFLFERSHEQTKRKYFVYKDIQSLRN